MLFRDAGADVIVTGTKPAAADYDTDLSGMTYRQLVLTDNASIDSLAHSISTLDVLVNNAGANFPGGLDESTPDGFAASVALNLTGPYRLTVALRRALKASTAAGGASVVNLASMSALRAVTMVPGYGAAKSGIINVTRNLAVKWAKHGIRVNAVAPGTIETAMTAPMHAVPEIVASEIAHIPAGRMGTVGEVAPDHRVPVHGAEQLHQRRGARRRRRLGLHLRRKAMTLALQPEDFYHTGIVVPDLDAAMARSQRLAGYPWIDPDELHAAFRTARGRNDLDDIVYSVQAPYLELVQEVPGTPWMAAPGNAVHHLGYFTDNLVADGRTVGGNGFTFEMHRRRPDPVALFAYY